MTESDRIKYSRVALLIVGLIFIGLWPLTIVWPSGWTWHAGGHSEYLEMIFGVYATLGVFLMIASRVQWRTKALSGSRFGPVSCMGQSWLFNPSPTFGTSDIYGEMSWL
jgi:uncharacterized protein DUF6632